jgi:hypothetical protein
MIGISTLQCTDKTFKFWQSAQILKTRILQKKRPTREARIDTSLKPFKRLLRLFQHGKNAHDLIVGMVRVSKRLGIRATTAKHSNACAAFPVNA